MPQPSYIALAQSGELDERVTALRSFYTRCQICPRQCLVDRTAGERGICGCGTEVRIASYGPHHGEEDPIRGVRGSGTIFLSSCNLHCVFCQNSIISDGFSGREYSPHEAAAIMLSLQELGCHNINWVTPTHFVPALVHALKLAAAEGLRLPVVYNTSAYDSLEVIRLLDGIVDIYMPDFKYWAPDRSGRYLNAPDYPEVARAVLREMHRQVGVLDLDEQGIARRGLLVRHLVMPNAGEDTKAILNFIASELSPGTYVNIMAQYHPWGRARDFTEINRFITAGEYEAALSSARDCGLNNLDRRTTRLNVI
ncbi:MAG: radical SAM protein [Candidatus Sumerlaeia bacterium]